MFFVQLLLVLKEKCKKYVKNNWGVYNGVLDTRSQYMGLVETESKAVEFVVKEDIQGDSVVQKTRVQTFCNLVSDIGEDCIIRGKGEVLEVMEFECLRCKENMKEYKRSERKTLEILGLWELENILEGIEEKGMEVFDPKRVLRFLRYVAYGGLKMKRVREEVFSDLLDFCWEDKSLEISEEEFAFIEDNLPKQKKKRFFGLN